MGFKTVKQINVTSGQSQLVSVWRTKAKYRYLYNCQLGKARACFRLTAYAIRGVWLIEHGRWHRLAETADEPCVRTIKRTGQDR